MNISKYVAMAGMLLATHLGMQAAEPLHLVPLGCSHDSEKTFSRPQVPH